MSVEQPPVTDDASQDVLPLRFIVAMATVFLLMSAWSVWVIGGLREAAWEARSETLTEKYGVTIKNIDPPTRDSGSGTWSVDGAERECRLSAKSDTLRCEDETGALVEVGQ